MGLRDDEYPDGKPGEPDYTSDAEIAAAAHMKVEGRRIAGQELGARHGTARQLRQRTCEQRRSRHDRDPEHPVPAERKLEVRARDIADSRLLLVDLDDAGRFRPQLAGRV